jgi:hypothetical protein
VTTAASGANRTAVSRTTSATAAAAATSQLQNEPKLHSVLKTANIPSKLEQQFKPLDDLHLINLKLNHIEIGVSSSPLPGHDFVQF